MPHLLYPRSPKGEGGILFLNPRSPKGEGVYCFTSVRLSFLLSFRPSSVQDIFRRIFLSNYWWQKSDIWSQASYRYTILWVAFLDPSDSYFLFADIVGFYTHWTYMHIYRHIFLSNYWWQRSGIWAQASYRYPISWEVSFDPSDSYFLFVEERGYHKWALAHSSSCSLKFWNIYLVLVKKFIWTANAKWLERNFIKKVIKKNVYDISFCFFSMSQINPWLK